MHKTSRNSRSRRVSSWPRLRQNERRTSRTRKERGAARRLGKMIVFRFGGIIAKMPKKMASTSEYFFEITVQQHS